MVDRDRTVNWLLDISESPAAYRGLAEDAVRLIEGLEEQVVEALAAQHGAEGEAAEANDRIASLLAAVNKLEADPRMALTRDDLAVAHRISEREAAAYAPDSITCRVWRRRAERLARAMAVAALAAVDAEGKQV